jgi:hypothetical protein
MRVEGRHAPRTFGRRLHGRSLAGSFGLHLALLALIVAVQGVGPAKRPKPTPIPIVLTTPAPSASPKPRPRAVGDLPVRRSPAPTPSPTPTPRPTPTPSASPTPAPTPRPTPKPTPKASPTPNAEKRKFEQMRKIPYFSKMTDEQLRKQPLPPGIKDWGEVTEMGKRLDGLEWLFIPPETGERGQRSPEPSARPTAAATAPPSPRPAPTTEASGPPGASPSPLPSPTIEKTEGGVNVMAFQVETTVFTVTWGDTDERAVVVFKPEDAPEEDPGRTFEVPIDRDQAAFLRAVLDAWQEALKASPSPGP